MNKRFLSNCLFSTFFIILTNSTVFGHEPIESIEQIPEKIDHYCKNNPTHHPIAFFDLDDTLIKSIHPMGWGSDSWFSAMYNHLKSNNIQNPLDIIFGVVTFVNAFFANQKQEQFITKTEDSIPQVLNFMSKNGVPFFGLTARTFILKEFTQEYLNNLGIHFSKIDVDFGKEIIINEKTAWKAIYSNGTIFCSGNNKGKIIVDFFNLLKFNTKDLVVFAIDDQVANLDKIEQALQAQNIPCVCLHYVPRESKRDYVLDPTTLSWLNLIIRNKAEC